MDPKDYLLQIVAQTVDALSFTQTHVIDEDFRAHNRATMDSVRSLQREQHNRVEQVYGPQSPSSDSLAQQLLSCYRGEITMLELGRGKEDRDSVELVSDLAISMSHDQCLALKREMKQRIHEWERVFREERGVAVATRDKAVLRHVYELYRLVKNRLRSEESPPNGEDVGNPNTAIGQQAPHQGQGLMHPSGGYGDSAGLPGGRVMTRAASPSGLADNSGGRAQGSLHQTSGGVRHMGRPTGPLTYVGDSLVATQPTVGSGVRVSQMTDEELAAEKRYLKRILHRFESDFEQRNGYVPTRSDRQAHSYEYIRYGELKNEIMRRMPPVAGV